jgi:phosphatidylinositol-3-phosphatase
MARSIAAVALLATTAALVFSPAAPAQAVLPRPDHTVVVVMENHSYSQVIGNPSAPFINSLRSRGANLTNSHGVTHPSEPNYLALFAGTTENLHDDSCPHTYSDENLASRLSSAGESFAGYSESMPSNGYTGCTSGNYARKHNPWVNFTNVPPGDNLTFHEFPSDYDRLPTVSIVVPNLCDDMHDCGVSTGDSWLANHIGPYVEWAADHNSLLVLTFDESAGSDPTNQIATIFVGPMVVPGDYGTSIDHYAVLRTIEDLYSLAPTGLASNAAPSAEIWQAPPPPNDRMPITLPGGHRPPIVVPFPPRPAPPG